MRDLEVWRRGAGGESYLVISSYLPWLDARGGLCSGMDSSKRAFGFSSHNFAFPKPSLHPTSWAACGTSSGQLIT